MGDSVVKPFSGKITRFDEPSAVLLPPLATAVIAWLHVFSAIGWLGAIMTFGMVIGPSVAKLSPTTRFEFFANVAPKVMRYVSCLPVPL